MRSAHGLDDQMRACDLVHVREVETFQDVERIDERDTARGWRRARDDTRAAIVTDHRGPFDHLVVGEVLQCPVATELLHPVDEFLRELALVEPVRALAGYLFQAGSELGLLDDVTQLGHFAIHQEYPRGIGSLEKNVLLELHAAAQARIELETVPRQLDGRRHAGGQRQLAVFLRQPGKPRRLTGNSRRQRRITRQAGYRIAVLVEIHVARSRARRHFAQVDHGLEAVTGTPDQKESAAAEAGTGRLDYGQRGGHGHRGIEGIATLGEDLFAGVAGQWIGAGDGGLARPASRYGRIPRLQRDGSRDHGEK